MGVYKVTLEDYFQGIRVIEEEFGRDWLEKQVARAKKRNRWGSNPIPKIWQEANKASDEVAATGVLAPSNDLTLLIRFASNLKKVRGIPFYDLSIRQKLKSQDEIFHKIEYEIYVADLCLRFGYKVEFILPSAVSGEKTADLKLLLGPEEFFVECAKKDDYVPRPDKIGCWNDLQNDIVLLLKNCGFGYEILILAFGFLDVAASPQILQTIQQCLIEGKEGLFMNRSSGFAMHICRLEPFSGIKGMVGLPFLSASSRE